MADFKVFINFKTYPQGTGEAAASLAKICETIGQENRISITPIVQAVDLFRVKKEVKIPIWIQHVDPQPQGQFTGWTNLEAVTSAGASGTLINHSEHQIPPGMVKQIISAVGSRLKAESGFQTMVCCKTLGQMERLVKLKPDFVGYEISEFIGTKTSVTDENPKAIKHAAEICENIPLIVGAGIHKAQDLVKAKELGAGGVLISSALVLAKNPKEKLEELLFSA